jgi:hypothetical protein
MFILQGMENRTAAQSEVTGDDGPKKARIME